MESTRTLLSYQQTGFFGEIVTDYLIGASSLQPFYEHEVSKSGIQAAIKARKAFPTNRNLLVATLREQYAKLKPGMFSNGEDQLVSNNISLLERNDTFTICTAHQPNIFTGYLYFVYKILHAVKLADFLKTNIPEYNFVPVYYMGSEDADLEELGKVFLNGEKLVWDTSQKGAVGRMKTNGLDTILNRIEGELSVQPYGPELIRILKEAYTANTDIQSATFTLLHTLFAKFGLVVLIADHPSLKKEMNAVFADDLFLHTPAKIVTAANLRLAEHYKVQANPRDINLFYLQEGIRNRIERSGDHFRVVDSTITFSETELRKELEMFPERFSPNVILRGLYQETILPNIAFIGGGGELAYWLELKDLFRHYQVPFPVQVLRNSFLVMEEKWQRKVSVLGFETETFFRPRPDILNQLVKRDSTVQLSLTKEIGEAHNYYAHLKSLSNQVDKSLEAHVQALEKKMVKKIQELEKKILRAQKRKFKDQERQIDNIKTALFPNNNLQERVENFMPYYAKYGPEFLQLIYDNSLVFEQQFHILTIKANTNETVSINVEQSFQR